MYKRQIHFGREKREKERAFTSKNTASSSKQYYLLVFFLKKQPTKKTKIRGGKREKLNYDVPFVPGIRSTTRTPWTTTNKLEAGPAAKGRDNEGQTRRSHVCFFGLVGTSDVPGTCPKQNCRYFSSLSRREHEKNKSCTQYFGDPQTGEVSY